MTKERPILFSTEMVQAILAGRKTQTRRVIKPQPDEVARESIPDWNGDLHQIKVEDPDGNRLFGFCTSPDLAEGDYYGAMKSPYGQPGDLLYVRETWKPAAWSESGDNWDLRYKAGGNANTVKHLFDDKEKELDFWIKITDELKATECEEVDGMFREPERYLKWRPSIFMPKNAARIWLQVKDVRVERLQDITEEDALSEGVRYSTHPAITA